MRGACAGDGVAVARRRGSPKGAVKGGRGRVVVVGCEVGVRRQVMERLRGRGVGRRSSRDCFWRFSVKVRWRGWLVVRVVGVGKGVGGGRRVVVVLCFRSGS